MKSKLLLFLALSTVALAQPGDLTLRRLVRSAAPAPIVRVPSTPFSLFFWFNFNLR